MAEEAAVLPGWAERRGRVGPRPPPSTSWSSSPSSTDEQMKTIKLGRRRNRSNTLSSPKSASPRSHRGDFETSMATEMSTLTDLEPVHQKRFKLHPFSDAASASVSVLGCAGAQEQNSARRGSGASIWSPTNNSSLSSTTALISSRRRKGTAMRSGAKMRDGLSSFTMGSGLTIKGTSSTLPDVDERSELFYRENISSSFDAITFLSSSSLDCQPAEMTNSTSTALSGMVSSFDSPLVQNFEARDDVFSIDALSSRENKKYESSIVPSFTVVPKLVSCVTRINRLHRHRRPWHHPLMHPSHSTHQLARKQSSLPSRTWLHRIRDCLISHRRLALGPRLQHMLCVVCALNRCSAISPCVMQSADVLFATLLPPAAAAFENSPAALGPGNECDSSCSGASHEGTRQQRVHWNVGFLSKRIANTFARVVHAAKYLRSFGHSPT